MTKYLYSGKRLSPYRVVGIRKTNGGEPTMKYKLSISVDAETVMKLRERMRRREFRNKSHLIESAINEFLKDVIVPPIEE